MMDISDRVENIAVDLSKLAVDLSKLEERVQDVNVRVRALEIHQLRAEAKHAHFDERLDQISARLGDSFAQINRRLDEIKTDAATRADRIEKNISLAVRSLLMSILGIVSTVVAAAVTYGLIPTP